MERERERVVEEQDLEVEEVILRASDESRSSIISGQDVPASCSRTISRLPPLMEEEPEQEQEQVLEGRPVMELEPGQHLELLRNSWILTPANSSRVWLLGTGSTS